MEPTLVPNKKTKPTSWVVMRDGIPLGKIFRLKRGYYSAYALRTIITKPLCQEKVPLEAALGGEPTFYSKQSAIDAIVKVAKPILTGSS